MDVKAENIIRSYENALARVVLLCVAELPFPLGVEKVIKLLKGSKSTFVVEKELQRLSSFSLLSCYTAGQLRQVVEMLVTKGLLKSESASAYQNMPVLKLTAEGQQFIDGSGEEELELSGIFIDRDIHELDREEKEMYEKLRALRYGIASDHSIRPYMVCSDIVLRELVRLKPADRESLLAVRGIGEKFADNFGDEFLSLIDEA